MNLLLTKDIRDSAIIKTRLEVLEIDKELADLREQRNRRAAPFCWIPDELVVKIYRTFQDQCITERHHNTGRLPWWGKYLSLCRRIRFVTHTAPELWAFIRIGGYDEPRTRWRTTLCLERAGNFPLTLEINYRANDGQNEEILALAYRTRELRISVNCPSYVDPVMWAERRRRCEEVLGSRWPVLQRAWIWGKCNDREALIGPLFLGGSKESLQDLTLYSDTWVPWELKSNAPVFRNLHAIAINGFKVTDSKQLQQWLSCMPLLSSINLLLSDDSAPHLDSQSLVHFPNLRLLELRGPPAQILSILPLFPDPLEQLSLDGSGRIVLRSPSPPSNKAAHTALIHYALEYLARQKRKYVSEVRYMLEFEEQFSRKKRDQLSYHYCLKPDLSEFTGTMLMGRLQLRGEKGTSRQMIEIMKHTDFATIKIKCVGFSIMDDVIAIMPEDHSRIKKLQVSRLYGDRPQIEIWENDSRLESLNIYLALRRAHGCPLKLLVLDVEDDRSFKALASAWMDEGLVGRIVVGQ